MERKIFTMFESLKQPSLSYEAFKPTKKFQKYFFGKFFLILIFIAIIILPAICAAAQQINVDTRANHRIMITIYEAGIIPPIRITSSSMYKSTGPSGDFSFTFSTDKKKIDIKLELKNDDATKTNTFTDVELTGDPIYINLFPPDNITIRVGSPAQNITPNTTTENITQNQTNTTNIAVVNISDNAKIAATDTNKTKFAFNFSITGYVTKFYEKNSKIFFYILIIIGVIVGILIILFIARKIPKKHHYPSPQPLYNKRESNTSDKSLAEAEKKLRVAQEEIERIKNRNQALREAERRLEEDRIRLEKLRRGY